MGYLRDVRRMTVALSRARLGLYILGRREVFEACTELRPAFDILLQRPDKLMLVTGELWPSKRAITEDDGAVAGEVAMENVEHLGQYVKQMHAEYAGSATIQAAVGEDPDAEQAMGSYYDDDGEELEPDIQEVREGEN